MGAVLTAAQLALAWGHDARAAASAPRSSRSWPPGSRLRPTSSSGRAWPGTSRAWPAPWPRSRCSRCPGPLGLRRAALVGLALGGRRSAPIRWCAPLVLAVGLALAWELRATPRRLLATLGVMSAAGVTVLLPYLLYLLRARAVSRAPWRVHSIADVAALALRSAHDRDALAHRPLLRRLVGRVRGLERLRAPGPRVRRAGGRGRWPRRSRASPAPCARRRTAERRLARVGVLVWPGVVIMLAVLGLDGHVHYQFPAVWVPFFGVAALVAALLRRAPRWGRAALAAVGAVALLQVASGRAVDAVPARARRHPRPDLRDGGRRPDRGHARGVRPARAADRAAQRDRAVPLPVRVPGAHGPRLRGEDRRGVRGIAGAVRPPLSTRRARHARSSASATRARRAAPCASISPELAPRNWSASSANSTLKVVRLP